MKLLILVAAIIACAGCERAADGKPYLADREELRPAPQPVDVLAQVQATADTYPTDGWSQ